jgi:hypothetical protein
MFLVSKLKKTTFQYGTFENIDSFLLLFEIIERHSDFFRKIQFHVI